MTRQPRESSGRQMLDCDRIVRRSLLKSREPGVNGTVNMDCAVLVAAA